MRLFFIVLLLVATQLLAAQVDSSSVDEEYDMPWKYGLSKSMVGLHLMPFSMASLRRPRLRIGAMLRNEKMTYLLDLEYGNKWIRNTFYENSGLEYTFYGVRPEVQYSLGGGWMGLFNRYIAIEIPITYFKKELINGAYDQDELSYSFDYARQTRTRWGVLFKTGNSFTLGDRWYLDYYFGIGFARRDVKYRNATNLQEAIIEDAYEWSYTDYLDAGVQSVVDFALGLRVGYFIVE